MRLGAGGLNRICIICFIALSVLAFARGLFADYTSYTNPADTICLEPCKDFIIILESNKTTGFGWDIAEPLNEQVVKFLSSEYVAANASVIGSGGKEVWTFRTVCPGKSSISFKYVRSWEKEVPPAKKMTFTLEVK